MKTLKYFWLLLCTLAVLITGCDKGSDTTANVAPEISNLKVVASRVKRKVDLTFELSDDENDELTIELRASNNFGNSFTVPLSNVSGDVGVVKPGGSKRITWQYPAYIHDIETYVFKIIARDNFQIQMAELLKKVDSDRIYADLKSIIGSRDNRTDKGKFHKNKVKRKLETEFRNYRLKDKIQAFEVEGMKGENVLGKHRGNTRESSVLVLGAHIDTVEGSPGADDNGSGLIGMLEVMRVIADYQLESSIIFAAWDLEENGSFGSLSYVRNGIENYERIDHYINLDMIGYFTDEENSQIVPDGFEQAFPDVVSFVKSNRYKADFLVCVANDETKSKLQAFALHVKKYAPDLKLASLVIDGNGEAVPRLRDSDHAVFWDYGIPAFSLTDGGETRNPNYDTPTDILATVNINKVTQVVKTLIAHIAQSGTVIHGDVEVSTEVLTEN